MEKSWSRTKSTREEFSISSRRRPQIGYVQMFRTKPEDMSEALLSLNNVSPKHAKLAPS